MLLREHIIEGSAIIQVRLRRVVHELCERIPPLVREAPVVAKILVSKDDFHRFHVTKPLSLGLHDP